MAGHPLRPARDRRLGGPLPRLLANPIWVHPIVRGPKVPLFGLATLCGISHRFQWLSPSIGQIPRHYSPVRHSSPESKLSVLPSDLHVLGLPPAFNLSHDQTLQFKFDLLKPVQRCSSVKRHNEFHYVFTREALIFFTSGDADINPASAHTDCLINC